MYQRLEQNCPKYSGKPEPARGGTSAGDPGAIPGTRYQFWQFGEQWLSAGFCGRRTPPGSFSESAECYPVCQYQYCVPRLRDYVPATLGENGCARCRPSAHASGRGVNALTAPLSLGSPPCLQRRGLRVTCLEVTRRSDTADSRFSLREKTLLFAPANSDQWASTARWSGWSAAPHRIENRPGDRARGRWECQVSRVDPMPCPMPPNTFRPGGRYVDSNTLSFRCVAWCARLG